MRKARKATRKTKRKPRLGMWKRKTRKGIRGKGDYNGREGKEDSKEKKGYLRLITQLPRQVCWTHFFLYTGICIPAIATLSSQVGAMSKPLNTV